MQARAKGKIGRGVGYGGGGVQLEHLVDGMGWEAMGEERQWEGKKGEEKIRKQEARKDTIGEKERKSETGVVFCWHPFS